MFLRVSKYPPNAIFRNATINAQRANVTSSMIWHKIRGPLCRTRLRWSDACILLISSTGAGKPRPAGQIRPAKSWRPAREVLATGPPAYSAFTLQPSPPNPKITSCMQFPDPNERHEETSARLPKLDRASAAPQSPSSNTFERDVTTERDITSTFNLMYAWHYVRLACFRVRPREQY